MSQAISMLLIPFLFTSAAAWSASIDESFKIKKTNLFPEGIAYDKASDRLFLGSIQAPAIYQVNDPTDNKTLTPSESSFADVQSSGTLGLDIDNERGMIYTAFYSADQSALGGIASFKLDDLTPQKYIQVPGTTFMNDVVVGDDGYVYATETRTGAVYSFPLDLSSYQIVVIRHPELIPTISVGANGLLYMNGFLLVANNDKSSLVKVPVKYGKLSADASTVAISSGTHSIQGADGLVRFSNSTIAVVGGTKTVLVTSDDDWETATVETSIDTPGASTGAHTGSGEDIYIVYPNFVNLSAGKETTEFKVDRISFDQAFFLGISMLLWVLHAL